MINEEQLQNCIEKLKNCIEDMNKKEWETYEADYAIELFTDILRENVLKLLHRYLRDMHIESLQESRSEISDKQLNLL